MDSRISKVSPPKWSSQIADPSRIPSIKNLCSWDNHALMDRNRIFLLIMILFDLLFSSTKVDYIFQMHSKRQSIDEDWWRQTSTRNIRPCNSVLSVAQKFFRKYLGSSKLCCNFAEKFWLSMMKKDFTLLYIGGIIGTALLLLVSVWCPAVSEAAFYFVFPCFLLKKLWHGFLFQLCLKARDLKDLNGFTLRLGWFVWFEWFLGGSL